MAIRIRTKILISFSSILALLSFLGFIAYYNRNLLLQGMFELEREVREMEVIASIQLSIDMALMPPNDYLITGNPAEENWFAVIARDVKKGLEQMKGFGHQRHIDSDMEAIEKFSLLEKKAAEIFAIKDPVGSKKGAAMMVEMDSIAKQIIQDDLAKSYEVAKLEADSVITSAQLAALSADRLLLLGAFAGVITAILLMLYLIRSIVRPIGVLKEGAAEIGGGNLDYMIDLKDGVEINLLVSEFNSMVARLRDSHATLDQKVVQRTSELKELNLILQELSITDGMTGLYNHRYFYEQLRDEIKKAERYKRSIALVMIDIDYFKNYNDTNGHPAGDDVLKGVASCIRDNVRELDLVARYGGEEFCVIAPETSANEAAVLAERIRRVVSQRPFPAEENQPNGDLTVSLGVASLPQNAKDAQGLIKSADEALYKAKQSGRNRVELARPIPLAVDALDAERPTGTSLD